MEKTKPAEPADGATAGPSSSATGAAAAVVTTATAPTPAAASGPSQLPGRPAGLASVSRPHLNEGYVEAVRMVVSFCTCTRVLNIPVNEGYVEAVRMVVSFCTCTRVLNIPVNDEICRSGKNGCLLLYLYSSIEYTC